MHADPPSVRPPARPMPLKQRVATGTRAIGLFSGIPHPVAVEIAARQGLDFICIDAEHALIGRGEVEGLIRACEVGGTPAMVRVPSSDPHWIGTALDAGAAAVLVPRVTGAAETADIVAASHFAPHGRRGFGPGRASRYGYGMADYLAAAREHTLVGIQVETAEALAEVDAIAATPGVDLLFVGPADLALSIGALGDQDRLAEAVGRIAGAGRAAGTALGIFVMDAAGIARWAPLGFTVFIVGSDSMYLGGGAAAMARAAGEQP